MNNYDISEKLCILCDNRHISMNELAEAIGKSTRQVSRYRNGQCQNITLLTLAKIADVLDVQISEFF